MPEFDFAIVGGGFFGSRLALLLAKEGARVVVIERGTDICGAATFVNQARVHNGYHYLRSYSTALGSHRNYDRFLAEFSECIVDDFDHIYAIGRNGSHTNAQQFKRFCRELGLPIEPPDRTLRQLFNSSLVEDVFKVRECAFDATAIRKKLSGQLEATRGIDVLLNTHCQRFEVADDGVKVVTSEGTIQAGGLFNVAYAGINRILEASGMSPLGLKAELAEICLVNVPSALNNMAITVMDGPFFSVMPMPACRRYSLSHVRYTPHLAWDLAARKLDPEQVVSTYSKASRFPLMQKDAQRYVPALSGLTYERSLFSIKAIPKKHELDDGRPIIFHQHAIDPPCTSVLGSKIDSVFELERAVRDFLASHTRKARTAGSSTGRTKKRARSVQAKR